MHSSGAVVVAVAAPRVVVRISGLVLTLLAVVVVSCTSSLSTIAPRVVAAAVVVVSGSEALVVVPCASPLPLVPSSPTSFAPSVWGGSSVDPDPDAPPSSPTSSSAVVVVAGARAAVVVVVVVSTAATVVSASAAVVGGSAAEKEVYFINAVTEPSVKATFILPSSALIVWTTPNFPLCFPLSTATKSPI